MQQDISKQIETGRQHLKWVCLGACLLALMNVGMGIIYDNYIVTVLQQTFVLGITATLSVFLLRGKAGLRWYFFGWLLLMAFGFFFQGGQRMIFQTVDGGLSVYVSVLGGLGLIALAVFLGGGTEISQFFKSLSSESDAA